MKALINKDLEFSLDDEIHWDCIEVKDGQFHIIYKNKSYLADIVNLNTSKKEVSLLINNRH